MDDARRYWSAIDKNRSLPRVLTTFVASVAYVCGHAMVLLYQIVALNVAMNSHSNALLTIVISNQFVEIKVPPFASPQRQEIAVLLPKMHNYL